MSVFRFDHAVILVADLDRAVADYGDLGFTVTPGGAHAGGASRNALIAFRDGSYLELLAYTRPLLRRALPTLRLLGLDGLAVGNRTGLDRRFLQAAGGGEGLIDFALLPPAIDADVERAHASGLEMEGPLRGGRVRPDGQEVAWRLGIPRTTDLPFLVADLTPHDLRVPDGEAREHANGVVGVAGVVVAVHNLEASSARYRALLGVEPALHADTSLSSRARVFPIAGSELILASPAGASDGLRRHLRRRGDGPYALRLRCAAGRPALRPERTHGARLEPAPA